MAHCSMLRGLSPDCTLMTFIRVLAIVLVSMILTMFDHDDDSGYTDDDNDEDVDDDANDEDISRVVICTLYEGFDLIQGRAGCIIVPHHRLNHQS